ncbi:MAG: glycosyltransferase family A protein [Vicinamibacterales bacterium]
MDVSIIVPMHASEAQLLSACLIASLAQRFERGRIEVIVVQFGGGASPPIAHDPERVRVLAVDHPTPYAARNVGAAVATGEVFLFTEPGCLPDPEWVAAHVERLTNGSATISVGHVAPERSTRAVDLLLSYENVRDEWVFTSSRWQSYFGRPRNMAITRRRFASHGPFVEVPRGADSTFVQRVARELSCEEIALTPPAIVRLQGIHGLPSFLRDRFNHAHLLQKHQSGHAAPVMLADRVGLFREAVRRHHYGPLQAATLLTVLGAGILTFRAGGWSGVVARRTRGEPRLPG